MYPCLCWNRTTTFPMNLSLVGLKHQTWRHCYPPCTHWRPSLNPVYRLMIRNHRWTQAVGGKTLPTPRYSLNAFSGFVPRGLRTPSFPEGGGIKKHLSSWLGDFSKNETWRIPPSKVVVSVVQPRPVSLLFVKGLQLISGSPYTNTEQLSLAVYLPSVVETQPKLDSNGRGEDNSYPEIPIGCFLRAPFK